MITNLVVMQPIDLCNLNCSYCYLPGRRDSKAMTDEVLEASIRCIFNSSIVQPLKEFEKIEQLEILWHSGEPLAAGIEYYNKAVGLIKNYNKAGINVKLGLQTNATLINQKWCDFFVENDFDVGVSIDGPEFIHDECRKDWKGRGSYHSVITGINCLKEKKLPLQVICVVTNNSLKYPEEIYKFFKELEVKTISFNIDEIECNNKKSTMINQENNNNHLSLVQRYKNFMSIIYDLWIKDGKPMQIREFDRTLQGILLKKQITFIFRPVWRPLLSQ